MLQDFLTTHFVAVLVFLLVLLLIWTTTRRPSNIPPGPRGLPIIGNLAALGRDPLGAMKRFRREYGDVYSLYMGNLLAVCVHGYNNIKEVLVTRGDEFADRPDTLFGKLSQGKSIGTSSGKVWKEHRRFALHTLRDFGFGKSSLEEKILEESEALLRSMEDHQGHAFDISILLKASVSNVICSIVFGRRFQEDDPLFIELMRSINENFNALGMAGALNFVPWLKYVPGDLFKYHTIVRNSALMDRFYAESVQTHKDTFDPDNIRDFIDAFIKEMRGRQAEDSNTHFDGKRVCIAESLAKMEVFLFATAMLQRFAFTVPEGASKPTLKSIIGLTRLPYPYEICAVVDY